MKVRKARLSDANVIAELNRDLAWETEQQRLNRTRVRRGVATLLRHPARGIYYVAEEDGGIIGQLMITYEWSDWRNGEFWWIQSVYVSPGFRRCGVFRRLFDHINELARRSRHVCGLRLYMHSTNRRARSVYEKLGLTCTHYEVLEVDLRRESRQ